jgi:hypothetical protein
MPVLKILPDFCPIFALYGSIFARFFPLCALFWLIFARFWRGGPGNLGTLLARIILNYTCILDAKNFKIRHLLFIIEI